MPTAFRILLAHSRLIKRACAGDKTRAHTPAETISRPTRSGSPKIRSARTRASWRQASRPIAISRLYTTQRPDSLCSSHPLPGKRGTLGRRVLRGVTVPSFDMNVAKSFRIQRIEEYPVADRCQQRAQPSGSEYPAVEPGAIGSDQRAKHQFRPDLKCDRFFDNRREDGLSKGSGRASVQLLDVGPVKT